MIWTWCLFLIRMSMFSMSSLNRNGARLSFSVGAYCHYTGLMHKYGAKCATDVTGFGLLGHARNLASNQKHDVQFKIHTLPSELNDDDSLNFMLQSFVTWLLSILLLISSCCKGFRPKHRVCCVHIMWHLWRGGLFVVLPRESAQLFIDEITALDGMPAWIIGDVTAGLLSFFSSCCDSVQATKTQP